MKFLGLLLIFAASALRAENLPDPTRPPPEMMSIVPQAGEGDTADGVLHLQSIVLPREGRPRAIINGRIFSLGEKVGAGRLTGLNENEAIISGPDGVQHLQLTPEAEKVAVRDDSVATKMPKKKRETP